MDSSSDDDLPLSQIGKLKANCNEDDSDDSEEEDRTFAITATKKARVVNRKKATKNVDAGTKKARVVSRQRATKITNYHEDDSDDSEEENDKGVKMKLLSSGEDDVMPCAEVCGIFYCLLLHLSLSFSHYDLHPTSRIRCL